MSGDDAAVRRRLEAAGQEHLLRFESELDESARGRLYADIARIDLDLVADLFAKRGAADTFIPTDLGPAPVVSMDDARGPEATARGEAAIADGRLAAFTVAGGQGTRLGWNGPKGTYPATPITGKPLFAVFAEQIRFAEQRYGVEIPWYVMTSPLNDAATRAFLQDNNWFGLASRNVMLFPQGTMPAVDASTGRILLEAKDRVAMSPDGHGGSLRALATSGALADMRGRGIDQVSYFQVDNPATRVVDPGFLGVHLGGAGDLASSGEMTSKMVRKQDPAEKVGVFCSAEGRARVVEYSDLPADLAAQRGDDGRLVHDAGNVAIHLLSVGFIERLTGGGGADGASLPFHLAAKKVPFIDDASGVVVEPAEPNGIKFETFVFDALPFATDALVVETTRVDEFAPIKNADGADSPASSRELQIERAARWLEHRGVVVPRDDRGVVAATIEISPLIADGPAGLDAGRLPATIDVGATVAI